MTGKRQALGQEGEAAAARFLKKQGFRIVQTNFRTPAGEIDIVAERDNVLVFVEVKTRSDHRFGHPLEALTPHKRHKIGQMASLFLVRHPTRAQTLRFDVVAITGQREAPEDWQIEWFADAFRL